MSMAEEPTEIASAPGVSGVAPPSLPIEELDALDSDDDEARLEIGRVDSSGGAAPYQAEGVLSDGRFFYFRARHNAIRLDVVGGHSVQIELTKPAGADHVWSFVDPRDAQRLMTFLAHTLGAIESLGEDAVTWPEASNTADWLLEKRGLYAQQAGDQS